jgi:ABC-type multidrug transport system fused ATPase/permease subunit
MAQEVVGEAPARWRALVELLRPDRSRWLFLTLLVGANAALLLVGPLVVRRVVDEATEGTTADTLVRLGVIYLLIAVVTQALAVAVAWYATIAAWRTTNELRMQMAEHVLGPDHEFHRSHTPGEFIVITGPVGAGKSTLLRGLLGLAWRAESSGSVRWNGIEIDDRAAFFVPPNAAFLSQVPQLISDSVADNVSLGPVADGQVDVALAVAAIAADVAAMKEGTDTLIGPRGLRLSGGQRQRLAMARALVHEPELLVLDDLSSAVDVETEVTLWDNLAARGATVIAVSHRAVAFERADRIIRLEAGRIIQS